MKTNRFTLLMAAFPFVLYACGSDDSGGGGGGTGGKKDAGTDSGKGGTGGTAATGGVGAIGGTGGAGLTGGTGGSTGGAAGSGGGVAGSGGGVAGAAGGGGTAGAAGGGGTAGAAGGGGTAGAAGGGGTAGADASVGGSAGTASGGAAGTDAGVGGTDGGVPANLGDTCAAPFVVGALPFTAAGSTVGATADYGFTGSACPPETASAGALAEDEVYAFTPSVAGKYLVTLTGGGAFDTALYVTTDCSNINANCVGADEDICSACSESMVFDAAAGTTYYIIVDSWPAVTGDAQDPGAYTLNVSAVGAANDTCANATPVSSLPFVGAGDTTSAQPDYGFGASACPGVTGATGDGTNDLVYSFTPTTSGDYLVTLTSGFDSAVYVATDCAMINATCLGAADANTTNSTEQRVFTATAGTTYYIFVDGYQQTPTPSASGPFLVGVSAIGSAPGDTCAAAIPISAVPFGAGGNTITAASDYGFAAGACAGVSSARSGASNDVVYSFNPTVTGSYTISLLGMDAALYVTTDCANINTTCLGAADDCGGECAEELTLNLTAGTTYYIMVDGWSNTTNIQGVYHLDVVKNP